MKEQLKVIGLLKNVTKKMMIHPESNEKSESTEKGQAPDSARTPNTGRRNRRRRRARRRRDGGRLRACYGCGSLDHFIANCPQPSNPRKEWYPQGNDLRSNQGAPEGSHVEPQVNSNVATMRNRSLIADGFVAYCPVEFLVDSGTTDTIIAVERYNSLPD